ncbi:thrombospondin type 3 repeat-containing protein [Patescibacteria group bacterium]|nr:thrombospondin type 3 repeat-containing protein [Patescibacteria group bacterium]
MAKRPTQKRVSEHWNYLAKEQKIAASVLVVCGSVALVLSMQQIYAGVVNPFTVSKAQFAEAQRKVGAIDSQGRELDESKRRDTDGDGISDFDEENIYGTSPYLRDTDGDGSPDNTELASGQNPNCASITGCAPVQIDLSLVASSSFDFINFAIPQDQGDELYAAFQQGINEQKGNVREATGSTSTLLEPTLVRDPEVIRKVLRESGNVDLVLLSQISDQELLQMYDEAMALNAEKELNSQGADLTGQALPNGY